MSYSSDEKHIKQYLQHEFCGCDIDEIMYWVEHEYDDKISIEIENDEWVKGDENLMEFIQFKLLGEPTQEDTKPQVFSLVVDQEKIEKLYKMLSEARELYYSEITEDEEFEDFKILDDFVASVGRMVEKNE